MEREGGPVDPLCCYQEIYNLIFSGQNHDQAQPNKNMLDYPIYKHLIQFSNLVDQNGLLLTTQSNGVSANPQGSQAAKAVASASGEVGTNSKAAEEKKGEAEENKEGGEAELAYEGGGGDTQNT